MDGLELQAAVEEVKPGRTFNVHGGAEHLLGEGLVDAKVGGAHRVVAEGDLHVQGHGDGVADQDEDEAVAKGGDAAVEQAVAEPCPEEDVADDFEPSVPPGRALLWALAQQQVFPAESVEVEAAKGKDWVVQEVLVADEEVCGCVIGHDPFVVARVQGLEEAVGEGKERHELDIWIMLGRIRDNVVHVVTIFPPP